MMHTADPSSDYQILSALQGIKCAQQFLADNRLDPKRTRSDYCGAAELVRYYDQLPGDIAQRLTEISPDTVERTRESLIRAGPAELTAARELVSDEARDQVGRAANRYRARLGLAPIGPDG